MASRPLALLLLIGLQIHDPAEAVDLNSLQLDYGSAESGDACKDCTQIFELMADILSNKELQEKLMDEADSLCEHLPGPKTTVMICKMEVKKMLPVAIQFITGIIKPEKVCKILGLCTSCDKQQKMLEYFANEALEAAAADESDPQRNLCSMCLFVMKTLEGLLPKKRTEDAVIHLLEDICRIFPSTRQQQCTDMIDKFSKIILDAILGYATPRSICELLRLCKSQDSTALDPCTIETYRCKDINTSLRCGTLFYCQKFAWKSENNV